MENKVIDKQSIKDINLKGKRIFLRLDLNIPIKDNMITNYEKITESIPTIKYIINSNPMRLVIGTHIGRMERNKIQSTSIILEKLNLLTNVTFFLQNLHDNMNEKFILLENLRSCNEEKLGFGNFFLERFDFSVVDAFATLHRNSMSIIDTKLPTYCGFIVERELEKYKNMEKIDLYIFGGSKAEDKLKIINKIEDDSAVILGVLSISVYKKLGINIGISKFEENVELIKKAILPEDYIVKKGNNLKNVNFVDVSSDECIVDIGNETIKALKKRISVAKTIFWNGPPGIFENFESSRGTQELIEMLVNKVERGGNVYVGGGDTVASVEKFSSLKKFSATFTAGGSLMTLLANEKMPGLDAIMNKTTNNKSFD